MESADNARVNQSSAENETSLITMASPSASSLVVNARKCLQNFFTYRRSITDCLVWLRAQQENFTLQMCYEEFEDKMKQLQSSAVQALRVSSRTAALAAYDEAGRRISSPAITQITDLDDVVESEGQLEELANALMRSIEQQTDEAEGLTNSMLFETVSKNKQQNAVLSKKRKLGEAGGADDEEKNESGYWVVANKPQRQFREVIDNSASHHWSPVLYDKPHAIIPLLRTPQHTRVDPSTGELDVPHVYEAELRQLQFSSSNKLSVMDDSWTRIAPLTTARLVYVSKFAQLLDMLTALKNEKAIAVDLEHHSFRSYQGFTCLLQLSTAGGVDYVIDTMEPNIRAKASVLNSIFANPRVLKIFHGADSDILWLQRDFNIYVVNMFDTHQAAKALALPNRSLAALLDQFLQIKLDKQYQTADWRIRPLPSAMLTYARSDAHYMFALVAKLVKRLALGIENVRNADGTQGLLRIVLEQSRKLCLQRYKKPSPLSARQFQSKLSALVRNGKVFSAKQKHALFRLYFWRDQLARQEDESAGFILSKKHLLELVAVFPLDRGGVENVIMSSRHGVAACVRNRVDDLVNIFAEANAIVVADAETDGVPPNNTSADILNQAADEPGHENDDEMNDDEQIEAQTALTLTVRDCSRLFGPLQSLPKRARRVLPAPRGFDRPNFDAGNVNNEAEQQHTVSSNGQSSALHQSNDSRHAAAAGPLMAMIQRVFKALHETK